MDLKKLYHDLDGNECNILQLVKRDPEWAANRIQAQAVDRAELIEAIREKVAPLSMISGCAYVIESGVGEALNTFLPWGANAEHSARLR